MIFAKKQMLVGAFVSLLGVVAASAGCGDLELDWGTYTATTMSNETICKYANVRFASAPVGDLRFAPPSYPPRRGEPAAEGEPRCRQMKLELCGGIPIEDKSCFPCAADNSTETEDCLFLDIYVPKSVFEQDEDIKIPVIVWIYGGAFVIGSKLQYRGDDVPFYDGQGLIEATDEPIIFVAGNYRLGAYGWLGGTYMEKHGQPNAGLLDQRAVLQFVQDHIQLVKGDPENVSVWGESAGAASIMHHLVMPANVEKPLFNRAILQSPAFQWLWNRTGVMNDTFNKFYKLVAEKEGCGDAEPMECLRGADTDTLVDANLALFNFIACDGIMPVGPSVDGKLIEDIASNVYSNPDKLAKIDSLIVSHVDNEVSEERGLDKFSFIPYSIRKTPNDKAAFELFLRNFMIGDEYETLRTNISQKFPKPTFGNQVDRARKVVEQSCFYCNTRVIIDAYRNQGVDVYAMNYAFLSNIGLLNLARHGTDLLPTFINMRSNLTHLYNCLSNDKIAGSGFSNFSVNRLGPGMRSYFVSHAISGDPNVHAQGDAAVRRWEPSGVGASPGDRVTHVMRPTRNPLGPFLLSDTQDEHNTAAICDYWKGIAQSISKIYNDSQKEFLRELQYEGVLPLPLEEQLVLDDQREL